MDKLVSLQELLQQREILLEFLSDNRLDFLVPDVGHGVVDLHYFDEFEDRGKVDFLQKLFVYRAETIESGQLVGLVESRNYEAKITEFRDEDLLGHSENLLHFTIVHEFHLNLLYGV